MESPAIQASYTKTTLNVQSPTEPSKTEITVFPDFNENSLDDDEKIRPDRKTPSYKSNEKIHITKELEMAKEIEDKSLRFYTAIPTRPTTTINDHHYKYDPKTTPNYKKYSFAVVGSGTDTKSIEKNNVNANKNIKSTEKTVHDKKTVHVVYGENVNDNVQNNKKKSHAFDFHYRIVPEISTNPSLSQLKDSLSDSFKLIKQSDAIKTNNKEKNTPVLQGYFDSEGYQFPLVAKDKLKTLPSTSKTIVDTFPKEYTAPTKHDLINEISKTILPPNVLKSLPDKSDVRPTLSLDHQQEQYSSFVHTKNVKYYDPESTKYFGNQIHHELSYTPQPDSRYTYAVESQFFVPHGETASSRADVIDTQSTKYTFKLIDSTTPHTPSELNDGKIDLKLPSEKEKQEFNGQPKLTEEDEKFKKYGYVLNPSPQTQKESNKDVNDDSNVIDVEGDLEINRYGYKIIPDIPDVKPTDGSFSQYPTTIKQEERTAKSLQTTAPSSPFYWTQEMSQFFVPYENEPEAQDPKKYSYHVVPQSNPKLKHKGDAKTQNEFERGNVDKHPTKYTYALSDNEIPPHPTESLLKYSYVLESTAPKPDSSRTSANASAKASKEEIMETSNTLPQFKYTLHPTPFANNSYGYHAGFEEGEETRHYSSTPLALGDYNMGDDLSADPTSTSYVNPTKESSSYHYKLHPLPSSGINYLNDINREQNLLRSSSNVPCF